MGCQSSFTTSKLSSNWIDSPIICYLPHYTRVEGDPYDWGNGYPVNAEKGFMAPSLPTGVFGKVSMRLR